MNDELDLLTVREMARMIDEGQLPRAIKIRSRSFLPRTALKAFLAKQGMPEPAQNQKIMTAYSFKRKRSRLFTGRCQLAGESKAPQVPLAYSNRQVAEKKLREIVAKRSAKRLTLSRRRLNKMPPRPRFRSFARGA